MFGVDFEYYRADSLDQAFSLLGEHSGAKLLAGGHSLIPLMKLRLAQPSALIDIGRLAELKGIAIEGGRVVIGALTTHAELVDSTEIQSSCRILSEAAAVIADPQVRNKGTLGGSIVHADPAADLPAVLVATDATIHLRGAKEERTVAAQDFFVGLLTTAIEPGEIVTRIEVPVMPSGAGCSYLKMEHPASGFAVCGAAAVVELVEGGDCSKARLCFNGVTATPYWSDALSESLQGRGLNDSAIDTATETHLRPTDPLSDAFASGEYRAHLTRVYGARALKAARDRAAV
jgi:carbon-monoxide dehydrogenase medium subunit